MDKEKYYVVLVGRTPGIYVSWEEARLEVEGYSGSRHRAFKNMKEASAYWESHYGNLVAQPAPRRTTYDGYGGGGYGVSGGGGYGGGGGGACYNCGQSGHMARDCYQGGGSGRLSNGGGGGGRGCYNCGEEGHFARECPYEQN